MTTIPHREFYESRKSVFTITLKKLNGKISLISNLRLAAALIFIALIYFGFSNYDLLYGLPIILTIFILLVRKHAVLFQQKTQLENLIRIQSNELQALDGNFSRFNSGSEFIDPHHPYTHDLDIFGEGSLFQYLNRISTHSGKKLLAERLASPLFSKDEIAAHQQAIKELSANMDFCHHIQATGMDVEENPGDQQQLMEWISHPSFLYGNRFYRIFLIAFPLLTVGLVITSFFVDGVSPIAVLAAGLQWAFLGYHLKSVNAFHQYISRKKNLLEKYSVMLKGIQREKFTSPLMMKLVAQAREADTKVGALASLVSALDARLNSMTNLITNSLLLYDLQCIYRLEKWKEENAGNLQAWLDAIREAEVLCSMASYAFNNPSFVFPEVNTDLQLTAQGLGHPLIDQSERVLNDIHVDREQSVMIITGANMAGKSTFLRTLGVNIVLALTGAPVCARKFNCPIIHMRTGMRTADSLKDHQSYFYAELDRLKSIMDELRSGKPLLILLDEILKGTNSTDKQAGSVALIKQLVDEEALVLIATHDLVLGNLEKEYPARIRNYCFEANIENDQLSFDYKLKQGLAQKMNATFLMKKMGIIPENTAKN